MKEFLSNYVRGFNVNRWYKWYMRSRTSKNRLWVSVCTAKYMRMATKCCGYVGREATFESCPVLPHGFHGIHISRTATIGKNVVICQGVTIGATSQSSAKIGDNVTIGANAVIIGNVHIGNNAKIGAGAIVVDDVPDNATVVSPKAEIIKIRNR